MDVVYVAEFTDGRQVYRELGGAYSSFGMELGHGPALETTYCQRLVAGEIPSVIPDATADPRVRDLPATVAGPVGAYVGVPLRFSDGRVYGTFCCLSHGPDRTLDARDGRFMELLAEMVAERLEQQEAGHRIRDAIEATLSSGAITVALQPIVSLADGGWRGAEALARFGELGVTPDVAFTRAHAAGLGVELELLALRAALSHLEAVPPGVYVSVNMSPTGVLDPRCADTLRDYAAAGDIVLELTEHASVDEYDALVDVLTPLRASGVRMAVDDVGAGYASFRHVLKLAPDIIKVDRFLVEGVAADPVRRALLRNIVSLAQDLGADVVAEGVEEPADLVALTDVGVDMAQGYLIARPSIDPNVWHEWRSSLSHAPPLARTATRSLSRSATTSSGAAT
jgi:EAL domain-containing protein (putative c-di-GMP-specific phosphodiesterase class I)